MVLGITPSTKFVYSLKGIRKNALILCIFDNTDKSYQ